MLLAFYIHYNTGVKKRQDDKSMRREDFLFHRPFVLCAPGVHLTRCKKQNKKAPPNRFVEGNLATPREKRHDKIRKMCSQIVSLPSTASVKSYPMVHHLSLSREVNDCNKMNEQEKKCSKKKGEKREGGKEGETNRKHDKICIKKSSLLSPPACTNENTKR